MVVKISNSAFQPSMNKTFKDADEFFERTVEEYKEWLIDNTREEGNPSGHLMTFGTPSF